VLEHPRIRKRPLGEGVARGVWWQEVLLPRAARADDVDVFFSPAYSCPLRLDRPRVTAVHDLSFFAHPQDFSWLDAARRRRSCGARSTRRASCPSAPPSRPASSRGSSPTSPSAPSTSRSAPDGDLPCPAAARRGAAGARP
jgi:hypothetical protein